MSSEELLIEQTEPTPGQDIEIDDAENIRTGNDDYRTNPELEELATDDEENTSIDTRMEREEFEMSTEMPEEKIDDQISETIPLSEEENDDHLTSATDSHEIEVIELDSEDEIENLEEQEQEEEEKETKKDITPEMVLTQSPEAGQGLDSKYVDHSTSKQNGGKVITNVDELSESEIEDLEHSDNSFSSDTEDPSILQDSITHRSGEASVPIFINVRGDEFLLVPFFDKCQYDLEDMISLFTFDEISDCTLLEFFELLRGNGDLIDAYNFDIEDELCLSIPEMSISITEDNVHTRSLRLNDLIEPYLSLIRQEKNDPKNVPDKMTVLVSMLPRFSTNFRKIVEAVAEGKGYCDMFRSQLHGKQDTDDDGSRKRRRTST